MSADTRSGFWSTAPGILTGLAALLTAATGAYLALRRPPASTPPAVDSATAASEPAFLRLGTYPLPELAELTLAPPPPALIDSAGFLRLTDAAFGTVDGDAASPPDVFRLELVLTNTTAAPLVLDLSARYFTLEDDRGRSATLLFFCCPAAGTTLPAGQSRTLVLYFRSRDWYGKNIQAHRIIFRVNGLLPIERAGWYLQPLATAA